MSSNRNRVALTPQEEAAGIKEARRRVKKRNGSGYVEWKAILLPGNFFRCSCSEGCEQRVFRFGDVSSACEGEYRAVQQNEAADVLARMRANNSGKKGRAA